MIHVHITHRSYPNLWNINLVILPAHIISIIKLLKIQRFSGNQLLQLKILISISSLITPLEGSLTLFISLLKFRAGDNLLTALSVCRECLMILPGEKVVEVKVTTSEEQNNAPKLSFQPLESISPSNLKVSNHLEESVAFEVHSSHRHYALDGRTWELLRTHFSDFIPSIIVKGTVFARMLPEQKTQLIQAFQELDYIVGMCGDGANDFGVSPYDLFTYFILFNQHFIIAD